jgi:hypothetical protein
MRRLLALAPLFLLPALSVFACGEDTATVAVRPEGGVDGGDAGITFLHCGAPVPKTYDGPAFATNAAEELSYVARVSDLDAKMGSAEGAGNSIVTAADLTAIYEQGTPSLKNASTSTAQALVAGYFTAFGDAAGKTWTPDQVEAEGGVTTGGKYGADVVVDKTGLHLRSATLGLLFGGALYNHALVLASGPVSAATIDRFLAVWGGTPKLATASDPDAGADAPKLVAALASHHDDPSQPDGFYRRATFALLSMKAAAAAGDACKPDLDAAVQVFLAQWEKTLYASAIFSLNDAAAKALATPPNGPTALRSLGTAIGFVTSMKGVAADRRKISDAQIDDVNGAIGDTTPYQLMTKTSDRVPKLVTGINSIANVYSFSQGDIESFEKSF